MPISTETGAGRAFEVYGTLNLGHKVWHDKKAPRELDIRTLGDTVTEDELRAVGMSDADIDGLLAAGTISDPDAPTRPSQAAAYAAHNFASSLAKHIGILTQRGADYTFDDETFKGIQAYRDGVSLDRIGNALRAAYDELQEG